MQKSIHFKVLCTRIPHNSEAKLKLQYQIKQQALNTRIRALCGSLPTLNLPILPLQNFYRIAIYFCRS